MEISAINNPPDIIKIPNIEEIPNNIGSKDYQPVQQLDQDWPENKKKGMISEEQIKIAIAQANKSLVVHNTRLEFSIHEKTKAIMVKVLDSNTGEVIWEAPPKKDLDMIAMIWEQAGLLIDKKA